MNIRLNIYKLVKGNGREESMECPHIRLSARVVKHVKKVKSIKVKGKKGMKERRAWTLS